MHLKPTLEIRIVELLVKRGFLNEGQLEKAMTVQRELKRYKPLGEICKELGFISGRELRDILSRYQKQIFLGELLCKMGVISEDQLNEAIEEQKRTGEKLGKILVRMGTLTSLALVDALSIQLGITKIHPKKDMIDKDLITKANESYFRKKRVLPLRLDADKRILTVVMEDPTDTETIGDLQKMFRATIEPAICPTGEIELVLGELFDVWFQSH